MVILSSTASEKICLVWRSQKQSPKKLIKFNNSLKNEGRNIIFELHQGIHVLNPHTNFGYPILNSFWEKLSSLERPKTELKKRIKLNNSLKIFGRKINFELHQGINVLNTHTNLYYPIFNGFREKLSPLIWTQKQSPKKRIKFNNSQKNVGRKIIFELHQGNNVLNTHIDLHYPILNGFREKLSPLIRTDKNRVQKTHKIQ